MLYFFFGIIYIWFINKNNNECIQKLIYRNLKHSKRGICLLIIKDIKISTRDIVSKVSIIKDKEISNMHILRKI